MRYLLVIMMVGLALAACGCGGSVSAGGAGMSCDEAPWSCGGHAFEVPVALSEGNRLRVDGWGREGACGDTGSGCSDLWIALFVHVCADDRGWTPTEADFRVRLTDGTWLPGQSPRSSFAEDDSIEHRIKPGRCRDGEVDFGHGMNLASHLVLGCVDEDQPAESCGAPPTIYYHDGSEELRFTER